MNAFINYLLEANLGLCFFLLIYIVFLRNETDFKVKRGFILIALFAAVIFPIFHFDGTGKVIPSIGDFVPPTWLPEFVVTAKGNSTLAAPSAPFDIWFFINAIYSIGVLMSLGLFMIRLVMLIKVIFQSNAFKQDQFLVLESSENKSSFSFFQFIFIGQSDQLSNSEKQQIIDHERVHVQQLHSLDILLMNVLSIFFWFNPFIKIYKKILVQLHEFEADARAVENRDMNNYCSLLAKVALLSADFKLANHFSNSLTLKRIEMMRTLKSKIRGWKIVSIALMIPAFFFIVSCQDQLADVTEIAKNSTNALVMPEIVKTRLEQLQKENPKSNYVVIQLNAQGQETLSKMEKQYGLPKSMEIFKFPLGKFYDEANVTSIRGESNAGVIITSTDKKSEDSQTFGILEYNEMMAQISESSKQDGEVFTIVEQSAAPVGGIESVGAFLQQNLKYPDESRKAKKEGNVVVNFIVNTDGSLSDFTIVKGVDNEMDVEALRVVKLLPNWNPAKNNGMVVRQRFVLPIKFILD